MRFFLDTELAWCTVWLIGYQMQVQELACQGVTQCISPCANLLRTVACVSYSDHVPAHPSAPCLPLIHPSSL